MRSFGDLEFFGKMNLPVSSMNGRARIENKMVVWWAPCGKSAGMHQGLGFGTNPLVSLGRATPLGLGLTL